MTDPDVQRLRAARLEGTLTADESTRLATIERHAASARAAQRAARKAEGRDYYLGFGAAREQFDGR